MIGVLSVRLCLYPRANVCMCTWCVRVCLMHCVFCPHTCKCAYVYAYVYANVYIHVDLSTRKKIYLDASTAHQDDNLTRQKWRMESISGLLMTGTCAQEHKKRRQRLTDACVRY